MSERSNTIVLDTIPLLYVLMGYYCDIKNKNEKEIGKISDFDFKKSKAKLLALWLSNRGKIILTPQILAELSNHAGKLVDLYDFFKVLKNQLIDLSEKFIPKEELLSDEDLYKFGLTDISLLKLASNKKYSLLTADWALKGKYEKYNQEAIHMNDLFNHFKELGKLKD